MQALETPLGIEDTVLLEDFGDDWNGRIYRVRNHKDESLGAGLGNPSGEITNNTSVDLMNRQVRILASTGKDGRGDTP